MCASMTRPAPLAGTRPRPPVTPLAARSPRESPWKPTASQFFFPEKCLLNAGEVSGARASVASVPVRTGWLGGLGGRDASSSGFGRSAVGNAESGPRRICGSLRVSAAQPVRSRPRSRPRLFPNRTPSKFTKRVPQFPPQAAEGLEIEVPADGVCFRNPVRSRGPCPPHRDPVRWSGDCKGWFGARRTLQAMPTAMVGPRKTATWTSQSGSL